MEKALHRAILIDLRLSKSEANAIKDVARGELDVERVGAFLYVLSKQTTPGLEPLVRDRGQKEAVIFASKDSAITNLAGVAGHRVAFGDTNSVMSFWAKVHLARAGIRANNLQSYVHLNGANRARNEDPSGSKLIQDRDAETQAHKRVIQEVSLGRADVGEAPRRHFEQARFKRHGLVPLLVYPVTPDVCVARPGLEPDIVRALRESLVSFQAGKDEALLGPLGHNVSFDGFEPASDRDFDDLRQAMQKDLTEFGAR
jgi:ABC-type phosphate/phosphonate transport system substrate-binding protein